ncbi:glycosyltransferase family 2 protein [Cellulosimicrobium arenosum]|uniref:Glycosyltransferase family 2 protein n=1 Tax=Cellulosimicrobium arenosum TaxID=2708133 RepID=A0A927G8L2_9MICO|nr:glycosyltransferase family 2 protein [Cellulosimicrobium arenosum]MBD8078958.1 glycosyltransferase family 2 protein [Cellulosimicrobium arenosum]
MSAAPPVSVCLPVYNGERYLTETLLSVRAQTFGDLEIVLSDNASTDATAEICREHAAADPRIRYVRHEMNRGGLWNFNEAIRLARGETVKLAAADDVLRPRFLEVCVAALDEGGPQVVLAYPRTQIIDGEGTITEDLHDEGLRGDRATPHERIAEVLRAQAAHLVFGLYRTDVLRTTRGLRPTIGNDVVVLTEMACRGRFALVPEQLFLQRRHATQFSAQGARQVQFHAPGKNVRFDFPHARLAGELWSAVTSSRLRAEESVRSLAAVTTNWVLPRWRGVAGDVRRAVTGR